MKKIAALALLTACFVTAGAQDDDPVIMTINGKPVLRSEFEYSYNKNNSEGVIDKKTVKEYVDLFVNYKLKVEAALDVNMDTLQSFRKEFAQYRDQQVLPTFATDELMEQEARRIYANTEKAVGSDGLIRTSHILLKVEQQATAEEQQTAHERADSIYAALQAGADFGEMARKLSQDPGTAIRGGEIPQWLGRQQLVTAYADAAFTMEVGQVSEPVQSEFGWHIIRVDNRKDLEPYDTLRPNIYRMLEERKGRERVASAAVDSLVKESDGTLTREDVIARRTEELSAADTDLKYLIQEYYDGLLLYEVSNREVWDRAAKDKDGLTAFFNKNKKKYKWDQPRFKGIVYHTKDPADIERVKECIKDLDYSQWAQTLRQTFNPDTIRRIRVEKGLFKPGDNAFVDQLVFGKDTVPAQVRNYAYTDVYGRRKEQPDEYTDVKGPVTADYQEYLEKEWVAKLRKRYSWKVDKAVLATVKERE